MSARYTLLPASNSSDSQGTSRASDSTSGATSEGSELASSAVAGVACAALLLAAIAAWGLSHHRRRVINEPAATDIQPAATAMRDDGVDVTVPGQLATGNPAPGGFVPGGDKVLIAVRIGDVMSS